MGLAAATRVLACLCACTFSLMLRWKFAWFRHVTHRDSLSKALLRGTLEGEQCCGWQRKCWMDNTKEWTYLPMPELLTRTSCRKDWKRIAGESSLLFPQWPNWSREWTELICTCSHAHLEPIVVALILELTVLSAFFNTAQPTTFSDARCGRLTWPNVLFFLLVLGSWWRHGSPYLTSSCWSFSCLSSTVLSTPGLSAALVTQWASHGAFYWEWSLPWLPWW